MYYKTLSWFDTQIDYIFFIYGLAFMVLGIAAAILHLRKTSPIPWIWLALFGFLHGINEWIDLLKLAWWPDGSMDTVGHVLAGLSFVSLLMFGLHRYHTKTALSVAGGLLGVAAWGIWHHPADIGPLIRYVLGFPAAMLAAVQFRHYGIRQRCKHLKITSVTFVLYALAAGAIVPEGTILFSSWLNHASFLESFGFPIQLFRMALALVASFSIWSYYLIHQNFDNDSIAPIHPPLANKLMMAMLLIVIMGYFFVNLLGERKESLMVSEFSTRATIASQVIDRHAITGLQGDKRDLQTPQYMHLKKWLADVNVASRFAYLMTVRKGNVYFLVDSEPADSPECSPPGQLYEETTAAFFAGLQSQQSFIIGPEKDRWGTYITAAVPLGPLLHAGEPVYLLFDIDYSGWKNDVSISRQFAILATLLFIALVTYFTAASNRIFHANARLGAERNLFIGGPAVVIKWKLLPERWQVIYVSANLSAHLGIRTEAMLQNGYSFLSQIHADDQDALNEALQYLQDGSEHEQELRLRHADGSYRWFHLFVIHHTDSYNEWYQGYLTEISSRKEAEENAAYLASHDVLTGLPRLTILEEVFTGTTALAKNEHRKTALMYLDLDRFSRINEAYGHAFGNDLILALRNRLRELLPQAATIGREGGDEFIIIIPSFDHNSEIAHIAETIHQGLLHPVHAHAQNFTLSCSIGISIFPDDGADLGTLMQQADAALAEAKNEGRGMYVFASRTTNEKVAERVMIEHQLQSALARGEFSLQYQPKIDCSSGRVTGAEALLRWKNPALGNVSPAVFIPLAEESGLITAIGEWVLYEAVAQNCRWRDSGLPPIIMAVNMSALQLKRSDFIATIRKVLEMTSLDPRHLELELTESILANEHDRIISTLHTLRNMGISVSIDDFGTGYSNFLYLKQFNVTKLKIDCSFISTIETDEEVQNIVDTMIKFAGTLGLVTIAEGVETAGQLELLARFGCDEIQGFYFSRPLDPADFELFLQNRG